MKWGQSLAMLIFTSLAIIGTVQNTNSNDITASSTGLMIVAFVAMAFCGVGAVILGFYNEKKIMGIIAKPEEFAPAEEGAVKEKAEASLEDASEEKKEEEE